MTWSNLYAPTQCGHALVLESFYSKPMTVGVITGAHVLRYSTNLRYPVYGTDICALIKFFSLVIPSYPYLP